MKILVFILLSYTQTLNANPINIDLEPFQLSEFLNGTFVNKVWNGTWISDDTFIFKTKDGDINKFNAADLKQETFLAAEVFAKYNQSSISLSPNQNHVLIKYNPKAVFRHSQTAQYVVYNIHKKEYYDIASKKHIQYAGWAPVGSSLAYVEDNNIFYIPQVEYQAAAIQITHDGVPGIIYNGVPDWVYEEEVLGTGYALWFSPDGNKLAFATFNDTNVKEYHYYMYGESGKVENQYPEIVKLRYPKVGTPNPTVAVKYVNLQDQDRIVKSIENIIPINYVTEDHILNGITWATNNIVVAVSENRVQNVAVVAYYNVETNKFGIQKQFTESNGWLTMGVPIYNKEGTKSILIMSQPEANDSYKHLVLQDLPTNEYFRLTHGKRVVLKIQRWDEENDLVYYSSTIEDNPSQQHTHVVHLKTFKDECLTCNFVTPEGPCKVAATYFSKHLNYQTRVCNGPGPTYIQIENLASHTFYNWEENEKLRNELKKKLHPIIKDVSVPLASGFKARARLWLPPNLDETSSLKYSVVIDVYAGPNSNRISDSFTTGIVNYFTTNRNYIYVQIDARGSGRNGDNLLFQVYRKLGTAEIEDQIAVTKYLSERYQFIDKENIGIWGWSYGGFATIWTLIKDLGNVFKFGLAVAPVTNFVLYDTIYTERYMGLPTENDNSLGYLNTDVTQQVESLRNKKLFLIHGNADDNVHYQQSMLLAKALEKADILFYQQSYPDENHAIGGLKPHLYHTIDNFFAQELQESQII